MPSLGIPSSFSSFFNYLTQHLFQRWWPPSLKVLCSRPRQTRDASECSHPHNSIGRHLRLHLSRLVKVRIHISLLASVASSAWASSKLKVTAADLLAAAPSTPSSLPPWLRSVSRTLFHRQSTVFEVEKCCRRGRSFFLDRWDGSATW